MCLARLGHPVENVPGELVVFNAVLDCCSVHRVFCVFHYFQQEISDDLFCAGVALREVVLHCRYVSQPLVLIVCGQNPSNDGVYISYDEGDKVDRLQVYTSLAFFVCTPGGGAGAPAFEHQKSYFQNHFGFPTAVVC